MSSIGGLDESLVDHDVLESLSPDHVLMKLQLLLSELLRAHRAQSLVYIRGFVHLHQSTLLGSFLSGVEKEVVPWLGLLVLQLLAVHAPETALTHKGVQFGLSLSLLDAPAYSDPRAWLACFRVAGQVIHVTLLM